MNAKETGGPAFPLPLGNQNIDPSVAGMTLRDYFAAKALQGWMSSMLHDYEPVEFAGSITRDCYLMADAMLVERSES